MRIRKPALPAEPLPALAPELQAAAAHYAATFARHGASPAGVDWPHRMGQELRFVQLLRIVGHEPKFSLLDFGCGYGALFGFLRRRMPERIGAYLGIDMVAPMIAAARRRYGRYPVAQFAVAHACPERADYVVGSGIFNVRLQASDLVWEGFVAGMLRDMYGNSLRGCAVNFLAPDADEAPTTRELYRPAPEKWIGFCARDLGAEVETLSGYGQREFTLLLRRPDACDP